MGGSFRSCLQNARPPFHVFILSSSARKREEENNIVKENNNVKAVGLPFRQDLKYPPTAVGGKDSHNLPSSGSLRSGLHGKGAVPPLLFISSLEEMKLIVKEGASQCRLDLNNPHFTAFYRECVRSSAFRRKLVIFEKSITNFRLKAELRTRLKTELNYRFKCASLPLRSSRWTFNSALFLGYLFSDHPFVHFQKIL